MPCVSADGKPTPTARQLLTALLAGNRTPEAIAAAVGLPLFRVRSSMRELGEAGWVRQEPSGTFEVSEQGREILGTTPG